MPSTVRSVLRAAELEPAGVVPWLTPPTIAGPGVYVVSVSTDPDATLTSPAPCPLNSNAIDELFSVRPELQLDGSPCDQARLAERISRFWLPDEPILYIGLAGTSVRHRVVQYYRTPLGARKPHAGGWFLKLLATITDLHVHYAVTDNPGASESRMLEQFCKDVSTSSRSGLHDPAHPFPFANLEWPQGVRKAHGITGAKEARVRAGGIKIVDGKG